MTRAAFHRSARPLRQRPVRFLLVWLIVVLGCARASTAQHPPQGQVQEHVVRGRSLEGNLLGLPTEWPVAIYLPPSYAQSDRRYPVLYVLHGITDSRLTWTRPWDDRHPGYATIQALMDRGIGDKVLQEMIVVVPDAEKTCHYTDSPIKGNWAGYVARDLVEFVDRTFRTIPEPRGRGIMGHSMGGHGAIKLAMSHPGVFGAVYAMNPSLLGWGGDVSPNNPQIGAAARLRTREDLAQASFYAQAVVGIGQCFSPNPATPLLTDMPFEPAGNGQFAPGAGHARWSAQMPVYMVPQHIAELRALRGLQFDSALEDEFTHIPITARALDAVLDSAGIPHTFEMYEGDHRNRLWGRDGRIYGKALPFFSRLLSPAEAGGRTPAPVGGGNRPVPAAAGAESASTRFWAAVQAGDTAAAGVALGAGTDVNALDTTSNLNGRRALNYAAERDDAPMIRWLARQGADVNLANRTGFTPLHHAAEAGAAGATRALLELGANPNAVLRTGSTPLAVARQRGHAEVVRLLRAAMGLPAPAGGSEGSPGRD